MVSEFTHIDWCQSRGGYMDKDCSCPCPCDVRSNINDISCPEHRTGVLALVCGGRAFLDRAHLYRSMDWLKDKYGITDVVTGAAKGADTLAIQWAIERGMAPIAMPAEWERYGKSAGAIRNQKMLDMHPNLVIAFPGGRGTAHMIEIARKGGYDVVYG